MRLKKGEKELCKQTIMQYRTEKTVSMREYNNAWKKLKEDHYCRLCLDLKHIAHIPIIDYLEANAVDGETLFSTRNYLKHYSPDDVKCLRRDIADARRALDYIIQQLDSI